MADTAVRLRLMYDTYAHEDIFVHAGSSYFGV